MPVIIKNKIISTISGLFANIIDIFHKSFIKGKIKELRTTCSLRDKVAMENIFFSSFQNFLIGFVESNLPLPGVIDA